jgi:hypothetical protein
VGVVISTCPTSPGSKKPCHILVDAKYMYRRTWFFFCIAEVVAALPHGMDKHVFVLAYVNMFNHPMWQSC